MTEDGNQRAFSHLQCFEFLDTTHRYSVVAHTLVQSKDTDLWVMHRIENLTQNSLTFTLLAGQKLQ